MRYLGEPLSDEERNAYIAAARSLRDARTRFRHQGRSSMGVDCAGLLVYGMTAAGRVLKDADGYGRLPYKERLEGLLRENFGEPLDDATPLEEGDVVLLKMVGDPSHVGIVTRHPSGQYAILHSYAQQKMVVEHRMDDEWLNYIYRAFRP
jgi:hypothetical protein